MRRRGVAILFSVLGCGGCVLLSGAADLEVRGAGGRDGGATVERSIEPADAGGALDAAQPPVRDSAPDVLVDATAADATNPVDAARPNLHPAGDFTEGCTGWYPYMSTHAASTTARSGPRSCRVCSKDVPDDVFTADDTGFLTPPPGARYRAEAWVRAAPGSPVPSGGVALHIRTFQSSPWMQFDQASSASIDVDDTWRRLEIELTVTTTDKRLNVYVGGETEPGVPCFLVDDVHVERLE
jgi:hypothetical protein